MNSWGNPADDPVVYRCPQCGIRLVGLSFCPRCGTRDVQRVKPSWAERQMLNMMMNMSSTANYHAICTGCGVSFQTNYLTVCPYCAAPLDTHEPRVDLSKHADYPPYSELEHAPRKNGIKPMDRETFDRLWNGEWP